MRATSKATVEKARSLRRALTPPEIALWQYLRNRPGGLKFRRQHPIGPFVADFYCPSAKLIIEVDGVAHDMGDNPARDIERNAWFVAKGFRVLRVPATEVKADVQAVATGIIAAAGA
ncbi:endonuclease domain-containing protein [Sphingosinicella sp. YJ22]|uniref:endonuclease domain-containing protein n=1 Tax=Sphingosinicella sp. YJ22 TaxID=1104780 RepID=UPI00140C4097|nr:endonuclease domain-containing protein [Sphingosinicella sp. YJ22]